MNWWQTGHCELLIPRHSHMMDSWSVLGRNSFSLCSSFVVFVVTGDQGETGVLMLVSSKRRERDQGHGAGMTLTRLA